MKRIILIIIASLLLPVSVLAQRGIPRDDKVTVSSTKVTKIKKSQTRTPKTLKTYEAEVGFQQMPSINVGNIDFDNVALGLTYIAGYRFNDWLFAGGGAEFNADVTGVKDFYLPVYGHIRTYFSKWIIRPYSSLSIGGFAGSHENYGNDSGFYGSFTVGADAHISDNLNMTLSCGLSNMGVMCQLGFSF